MALKLVEVLAAIWNPMVCNAFRNWEHIIQNCQITLFDDSNACHFEFNMADIWWIYCPLMSKVPTLCNSSNKGQHMWEHLIKKCFWMVKVWAILNQRWLTYWEPSPCNINYKLLNLQLRETVGNVDDRYLELHFSNAMVWVSAILISLWLTFNHYIVSWPL